MRKCKKILAVFLILVFIFTMFTYAVDSPLLNKSAYKIRKYMDKKTEQEIANENEEGAIEKAIKKLMSAGTYLDLTKNIPKLQKAQKLKKADDIKNTGLIRSSDKFYEKTIKQDLNELGGIDLAAVYYEYEHYKPIIALDFDKNEKIFKKIADAVENKKIGTVNRQTKTIEFNLPQMSIDIARSNAQNEYNETKEETEKEIDIETQKILGTIVYNQPENISKKDSKEENLGDLVSEADDFVEKGSTSEGVLGVVNTDSLQSFSKTFYNIFLEIGIAVAVIVGIIIGVKFMVSSVEEKADIKQLLVPYIAGCIVVFGAFGIWKLVIEILENV